MTATKQAAPQRPSVPADRQRHARPVAYLGCAAALGYGVLKLVWSLGGTIGLRGNRPIVRPLLRALAWAGSLVVVAGVGGLILTIQYYAGDLSPDRLVDQAGHVAIQPATFLFVYVCFLVLGVAFGVTAWLTRR